MNAPEIERIMALLREVLPDLADELEQDFRLGRAVPVRPREEDSKERSRRLADQNLAPLSKADVLVVPYSDDERMASICDALCTLADTMYRSREALSTMAAARKIDATVQFGDAAVEEPTRINLATETARARDARDVVFALIGESRSPKESFDEDE